MIDLNTIWFALVGILLTGYLILDGFDFGVGSLHLFAKNDIERRSMINSIGPVWDGNEVWLITGGGALFAAFPEVYATVFSGFYLGFMLFLFALIFRASSIEFRSKKEMTAWRSLWDTTFCISSILAGFLLGVVGGNLLRGIPLDKSHEFTGTFLSILNPYALLVGATAVALFAMHGALYSSMKNEGELEERAQKWAKKTLGIFAFLYILMLAATWYCCPRLLQNYSKHPWLYAFLLLHLAAFANIFREVYKKQATRAFFSSSATIFTLSIVLAIGMFPNLVYSTGAPEHSLNVWNASSSAKTLQIMLIVALIGMPMVLAYTAWVYRVFQGKVKLDASSY